MSEILIVINMLRKIAQAKARWGKSWVIHLPNVCADRKCGMPLGLDGLSAGLCQSLGLDDHYFQRTLVHRSCRHLEALAQQRTLGSFMLGANAQ